ncbi:MAG: molybdopterin oxidoreductase family protein [Proteobacteria bacterium]|nr:molybdopterin oxidoreductase family protein [Pseudomonadota bacterium]
MSETAASEARQVHHTCPLCEATCGLTLTVEGDRVTRVRGDDEDVFSRGYLCPKGARLADLQDDADWLEAPLVRRGNDFERVSWDEAFQAVADGLLPVREKYGSNAVAAYLGNPNVHNLAGAFYVRPLLKALGSQNLFSASTVDQMPKHVSSGYLFGRPDAIPVPDLDRTDYLLLLGANPAASNGSLCTAPDFMGRLRALRERGGKLVVVDPRRTQTTDLADLHCFIRPGTDAAWLLSILHVLFAEGLADLGAVADFAAGADEVQRAVEGFSPERTAAATGIQPETTRQVARELAAAKTAAVYGRIGTHTVEFGSLAAWAVDLVNAFTGNLDRPGGALFPRPAHARPDGEPGTGSGFRIGRWRSRVRGYPEVRGELPVATLADEIETPGEGQVRALVTVAGNPVLSTPHSTRLDAALAGLDFMVCVDPYLNETTRHADVILPPPRALERSHYDLAFYGLSVRNVANYSPAVFPAPGPSEADLLARLALVLGGQGADADPSIVHEMMIGGMIQSSVGAKGSVVAGRDPAEIRAALGDREPTDQLVDILLRTGPYGDGFGANPDGLSLDKLEANPHGIDLGPLQPRLPGFLATPSGRIELAPPPLLEDLARLESRIADAPDAGRVLIGRRHVRSNNSWLHNVSALVRGRDRCTLQVHPEDAQELGLADGAKARVSSRVGSLVAPVELCDDLLPGVVSLPHGWGHDVPGTATQVARRHPGVNSNVLTDGEALDPLSGNAVLNGIPVQVEAL